MWENFILARKMFIVTYVKYHTVIQMLLVVV
jgi:hypothetical protein